MLVVTVTAAAPTLDEFHSWMAVHGVLFGNYGWRNIGVSQENCSARKRNLLAWSAEQRTRAEVRLEHGCVTDKELHESGHSSPRSNA